MQAIIFTGLQASGKSTYYKRNVFDTHVRVNLDMLKGSGSKERKFLEGCIAGKTPCAVDNTNLTADHRKVYIQMFKQRGMRLSPCTSIRRSMLVSLEMKRVMIKPPFRRLH